MLQEQIHIERLQYVDDPTLDELVKKHGKRKVLQPRELKEYPSFAEFYISYDVSQKKLSHQQILLILIFVLAANVPVDFLESQIQAIFVLDVSNFTILDYFEYLLYNYISALLGASLSLYFNRIRCPNHALICIANLFAILLVALACLLNIYSDAAVAQILISLGFFKYNLEISSSALICRIAPLSVERIVFHFGYVFQIITEFLSDVAYISFDANIILTETDIVGEKLELMFERLMERSISNCALAIVICIFCYEEFGQLTKLPNQVLRLTQRARIHQMRRGFSHSREYWVLCFIFATMYISNIDETYINATVNIKFYFFKPIHFMLIYHGFAFCSAIVGPFILEVTGHRPVFLLISNMVVMACLMLMQLEPTFVKLAAFAVMGFCSSLINPLTKEIFGAFSTANTIDFAYFISILTQTAVCILIPIFFNGDREGNVQLFWGEIRFIAGTSIICSGFAMLFSLVFIVINVRRFHGLLNGLK